MEAPKPVKLNTPENEEIELQNIKEFEVKLNNELYKFEFAKTSNNESIIFRLINNNSLLKKYYFLVLKIEELYNHNSIFKFYKDINEIYDILLELFNNNNYSLISKENNIILKIKFNMPGKTINIEFKLKEKIINNEKLIENVYEIMNKLIKENESMKNELNIIKSELYIYKEELDNTRNDNQIELNKIKDENLELKERIKHLEDLLLNKNNNSNFLINDALNSNKNNIFNDSLIVKDEQDKNLLNSWISEKGNIAKLNLLYRATKDGDTSKIFFEKCSHKGPTISLIKTKKGRRFGGFTKTEWTDKQEWKTLKDKNAFLFSLDDKKKYKILKPDYAMRCIPYNYCLAYGNDCCGEGLCVHNGFLQKSDNWENNDKKVYDLPSDNCLSGEKNFSIEELEVYQIKFKK